MSGHDFLTMFFRSVDLYGSSVQEENEGSACSAFRLENESGTGNIVVYHVFPGMEYPEKMHDGRIIKQINLAFPSVRTVL